MGGDSPGILDKLRTAIERNRAYVESQLPALSVKDRTTTRAQLNLSLMLQPCLLGIALMPQGLHVDESHDNDSPQATE
jgi:hypothetical protein